MTAVFLLRGQRQNPVADENRVSTVNNSKARESVPLRTSANKSFAGGVTVVRALMLVALFFGCEPDTVIEKRREVKRLIMQTHVGMVMPKLLKDRLVEENPEYTK